MTMNLEELRLDCAIKQKKGLHFILAAIVIWCAVLLVHIMNFDILTKNFITFFAATPLMPLAFVISKFIKVDFQNKENPLMNLGILFSANQMLYILIVMWVYPTVPEKMLMVFAIVTSAHLLPFSWLYTSKSYMIFSILMSLIIWIVGLNFEPYIVAMTMIAMLVIFAACLAIEVKKLPVK